MKKSKWMAVVTAMALTSSVSWGMEEVKVDVEKEETGKPIPKEFHVKGQVKTRPQNVIMDENAGTTVIVDNVPQFKGKGIVVKDNSTVKYAGISFYTISNTGKIKIHFVYLGMDSSGNNFVNFTNAPGQMILALMFKSNLTDLVVSTNEHKLISGVFTDGVPATIDILIDIPAWTFTVDVNDKKIANGSLSPVKEKNLLATAFVTCESTTSSFAVKDIAASEIK